MTLEPPVMQQDVLTRLCQDHREIGRLLVVIEDQCRELGKPAHPDIETLEAIRWYLATTGYRHHVLEDRIFTALLEHVPQFGKDIYDPREDHDQSALEFNAFSRAIDDLKAGTPGGAEAFCESAQAYIANERGHFISEEELFFPYARSKLTPDQWAAVGVGTPELTEDGPSAARWAKRIQEVLTADK